MPTALSTINIAKEQAITYPPLVLATITLPTGTVLRYSTHPLNPGEGGFAYGGQNYLARMADMDLGAIQLRNEAIEVLSSVTIRLHDPDALLYSTYEVAGGGFRGGTINMIFLFWNPGTNQFSNEWQPVFRGTLNQAAYDRKQLILQAFARNNLLREFIPNTPISPRCPLINPTTTEQRAQASDELSRYYRCGETRDLITAPPCTNVLATCTRPLRYAGINYEPAANGRGRDYLSGQVVDFKNFANPGKYGKYFGEGWGYAWVPCEVLNNQGDGNSTRGEASIGFVYVHEIIQVIVNGIELPAANSIDGGTNYRVQDALLRYNVINRGDRDGSPNLDTPFNGTGDPYGNIAAFMYVVPKAVADPASAPDVRALCRVGLARVYTDPTTYTSTFTLNPAWILLAILLRCGLEVSEIDIPSFIAAAAICDASISYVGLSGVSSTHPRFRASVWYGQRGTVADAVRRLLLNFGGVLYQAPDGKIRLLIEGPLAEQQPSAVNGSNYNTPISSTLRNGSSTSGYAAYRFTETEILADPDGSLHVKFPQRGANAQPNRVQFELIDEDYRYARSFMTLVDPEDIYRMADKEETETLSVDGLMCLDQAKRVAKLRLDKSSRGNSLNNTSGTIMMELETSFRAVRIQTGQLIVVHLPKFGIEEQLFRVTGIAPSSNFETAWLNLQWHEDVWYRDTNGQNADPLYQQRNRDRLERPSFPWCAGLVAPIAGDSMYDQTELFFSLTPIYEPDAGGNRLAKLKVTGIMPINDFSPVAAPLVNRQATTSPTGGSIAGGGWVYYGAICGMDADDKSTAPSLVFAVAIPAAGSTFTISVGVPLWGEDTVGWKAYLGRNPNLMTLQATGTGTPSSITFEDYNERHVGCPDVEADKVVAQAFVVEHSGVLAKTVEAVAANQFTITGAGTGPSGTINFTGYDLSVLAMPDADEVPVANFRITANTDDVFTVTPDPIAAGIPAGALIVIRSKPVLSDAGKTFTDPAWENDTSSPTGLEPTDEIGRAIVLISGTGRGQLKPIVAATSTSVSVETEWDVEPDATTRYSIVQATSLPDSPSSSLTNHNQSATVDLMVPISNYKGRVLLVKPFTLDGGGNASLPGLGQEREIYIAGEEGDISESGVQIAY